MNRALFVSTFKSTYQLIGICTAALILYAVAIIGMFNPSDARANQKLLESLPPAFTRALGMQMTDPGLTSFLATAMYSLPFMLFMVLFAIIAANGLIARKVDRGSMAYYLSTPVSRGHVALTQASILVSGQIIMVVLLTLVSILVANARYGSGALGLGAFLRLNVMGFCLFFVVGAFSFLFSCLFNEERYALSWSAGLTVLLYAINAIGNLSGGLSWLNKISPFGAFTPAQIVNGSVEIVAPAVAFVVVGILLYGTAIVIFTKRNLPL